MRPITSRADLRSCGSAATSHAANAAPVASTRSVRSSSISSPATSAPRSTSSRQIALPMKPPAPVTATLRPSNLGPSLMGRTYTRRALRWPKSHSRRHRQRSTLGTLVRTAAIGSLPPAALLPLVRKRFGIPPPVTIAALPTAPFAPPVLRPRTRARDVGIFVLQMWAFTVAHELPFDDPERLRRRLNVRYPIRVDRALGWGELPTHRLQRVFSRPGPVGARDVFLTIVHWAWFFEPHLALLWVLLRDEERFPRAARQMAAAFDLGCALVYLGEHYVVDLLVGAALVALVRGGEPLVGPLAERVSGAVQRLELLAAN